MKTSLAPLAVFALATIGLGATANVPGPLSTPSASLGIEVDLKPVEGKAGQFLLSSVVTDLESNSVIARPRLLIAANKPARIDTGSEGKWRLEINVAADGATRKASYDATFSREGKVVSKQRVTVNLDG